MPQSPLIEAILEAIYDLKSAGEAEKADCQRKLGPALDKARAGTVFSRSQIYDHVRNAHYPDYARRRRLRDRPKL